MVEHMTKEELKERIADLEWEDFEAKTAKSELPKDIWESVSSFSNCYGGKRLPTPRLRSKVKENFRE